MLMHLRFLTIKNIVCWSKILACCALNLQLRFSFKNLYIEQHGRFWTGSWSFKHRQLLWETLRRMSQTLLLPSGTRGRGPSIQWMWAPLTQILITYIRTTRRSQIPPRFLTPSPPPTVGRLPRTPRLTQDLVICHWRYTLEPLGLRLSQSDGS